MRAPIVIVNKVWLMKFFFKIKKPQRKGISIEWSDFIALVIWFSSSCRTFSGLKAVCNHFQIDIPVKHSENWKISAKSLQWAASVWNKYLTYGSTTSSCGCSSHCRKTGAFEALKSRTCEANRKQSLHGSFVGFVYSNLSISSKNTKTVTGIVLFTHRHRFLFLCARYCFVNICRQRHKSLMENGFLLLFTLSNAFVGTNRYHKFIETKIRRKQSTNFNFFFLWNAENMIRH